MSQGYHTNAKTNMHSREIIQQSDLTNIELSERFEINEKTVAQWKNREHLTCNIGGRSCFVHLFFSWY